MTASLQQRVRRRVHRYHKRVRAERVANRYASGRVETPGLVEHLDAKSIRGWIEVDPQAPLHKVGLFIDDVEAATVTAVPREGDRASTRQIRTFNFTLYDFWKFTTRQSQITVRVNRHRLPFAMYGMYYTPLNDGSRSLDELQRKRAKGWIFTSDGRFRLDKNRDLEWQADVMSLYRRVYDIVHRETGYEPFLIYGSLLGAVRDKGFIGHDFDVDTAYVSSKPTGAEAGAELVDLGYKLLEAGFVVEARVVCLHIYDPRDHSTRIDLFHLYFHPEHHTLRFAWGLAGEVRFTRAMWRGTREIPFAGTTVRIPRNARKLVEAMYGTTWNIPNAGFSWDGNRKRRAVEAHIDTRSGDLLNWDCYYTFVEQREESDFALQLLADVDLPPSVVDLGCGDGRDSLALARAGHAVLGADFSPRAVERATQRAAELATRHHPIFTQCDFGSAEQLTDVLERARQGGGRLLYYGRFLLHALPDAPARTLLDTIYTTAQPGDVVALEFRTTDDAKLPKDRWLPTRRYIDAEELRDDLAAHQFDKITLQSGTDLAPQGRENPHVARIVATRIG